MIKLKVQSKSRSQMVEITHLVRQALPRLGNGGGAVMVYVPPTTAGCTIQENADPDVQHDLLAKLDKLVPKDEAYYRHDEGNSDSHLKTAMVGNSLLVPIDRGGLALGQWQGIYLCEFDGPRTREVYLTALAQPTDLD